MSKRKVAVILAGGKGTRLGPYTAVFPKPLVPIAEYPIIELIVRQLVAAGFNELVFSTGHLAELIEAYFLKHPLKDRGVTVRFVREDRPLGTAGSLRLIDDLPSNFLVMNGDVFTTLDFGKVFRSHVDSDAAITIATHNKTVKIQLGVIEREEARATRYIEKPTFDYEVSMGVYVYTNRAVSFIPENSYFDFPDLVKSLIAAGEYVHCHPSRDDWLDIGNPDDYATAQEIFAQNPQRYLKEIP
jgi:NDP-sugar pyrophosphorylase family protein